MLQMMLENAMPQARRFGCETGGWRAATFAWRNHALLISKCRTTCAGWIR